MKDDEITMATITEDYVNFETAKLLKEKGFDGDTTSCYILEDSTHHIMSDKVVQSEYYESQDSNEHGHLIQAPTLQMAMKWLLKKYNIFICPLFLEESNGFGYTIENIIKKKYIATSKNSSYKEPEDACEAGIKYCLENLI